MDLSIRQTTLIGFGTALRLLLLIGGVSYRSTTRLIEDADRVAHTHKVLGTLETVLPTALAAETAKRAYAVTGEDRYLEPHDFPQLTDAAREIGVFWAVLNEPPPTRVGEEG